MNDIYRNKQPMQSVTITRVTVVINGEIFHSYNCEIIIDYDNDLQLNKRLNEIRTTYKEKFPNSEILFVYTQNQ